MSADEAISSHSNHQDDEDVATETLLVSDATSTHLRHIQHRNNRERVVGQRNVKTLENERKNKQCQLAREEKEIREHLQRLHQEQKLLTQLDSLQDKAILQSVSLSNSTAVSIDDISLCEPQDELVVVNPYPVALRPAGTTSGSNSGGSNTPHEGISYPLHHGRRRVSIEFEDLDIQTSTGKVLAPRRPRSMRQFSLFLSDSMISMSSNQQQHTEREEDTWAGSPEAIHSIRRPRKTIAQQRLEKLLARSNTHQKDRESGDHNCGKNQMLSSSTSVCGYLNRSQSLKERPRSHRSTTHDSHKRSNSWKEKGRKKLTSSVESVNEELHFLDLNQRGSARSKSPRGKRGGSRNAILSRQSSCMSLRDYVSTPETKSAVWGVVTTPYDDLTDGATHALQLHRGKNRVQSSESVHLPPIATDGSTGGCSTATLSTTRNAFGKSLSPLSVRRGTKPRDGSFMMNL